MISFSCGVASSEWSTETGLAVGACGSQMVFVVADLSGTRKCKKNLKMALIVYVFPCSYNVRVVSFLIPEAQGLISFFLPCLKWKFIPPHDLRFEAKINFFFWALARWSSSVPCCIIGFTIQMAILRFMWHLSIIFINEFFQFFFNWVSGLGRMWRVLLGDQPWGVWNHQVP